MIESYNNLLIKENSLDISNQNDDNKTLSEISSIEKINATTGINIIDNDTDTDTEDQIQPLYKKKYI